MPESTFRQEVTSPTLDGFLRLKQRWGASVQAMVMRAFSLGLIDGPRKTELFRQMSAKGWRKAKGEPLDELVPEVKSSLGRISLDLLVKHNLIQISDLPAENPFPQEVLEAAFGITTQEIENSMDPSVSLIPERRTMPAKFS